MTSYPHERAVLRWNYLVLGTDLTLFVTATQIASFTVVIPLYITTLTTANWPVTLVAALYNVGISLPPVFIAFRVEQLTRLMPPLRWMALVQRVPFLLLGASIFVIARGHQTWLLATLVVLVLLHALGQGIVNLLWLDIVSRSVGSTRFSRFMGQWGGAGTFLGVGGAALASFLLSTTRYPLNFALCFLITFGLMMGSYIVQQGVREPPRPAHQPEQPTPFTRRLRGVLAGDRRFRRALLILVVSALPQCGSALYIPLARHQAHMTDAAISAELIVLEVALIVGSLLWGYVIDHIHPRVALLAALAVLCASVASTLVADNALLVTVAISCWGVASAGTALVRQHYPIRYSSEARRPVYLGLSALAYAPVSFALPLLGGIIADHWGYAPVYTLDLVLGIGALIVVFLLAEGARQEGHHAYSG